MARQPSLLRHTERCRYIGIDVNYSPQYHLGFFALACVVGNANIVRYLACETDAETAARVCYQCDDRSCVCGHAPDKFRKTLACLYVH